MSLLARFFRRLVSQLRIFWFIFQWFHSLFEKVWDPQRTNHKRIHYLVEVHGKAKLHTNSISFALVNERWSAKILLFQSYLRKWEVPSGSLLLMAYWDHLTHINLDCLVDVILLQHSQAPFQKVNHNVLYTSPLLREQPKLNFWRWSEQYSKV